MKYDSPSKKKGVLVKLQTLLGPVVPEQAAEVALLADLLSVPRDGQHGLFEMDPQKRKELASETQKIINEEAPALYIGELNVKLAMRDDITGFVLEPDHLLSFYELCREKK